MATGGHDTDATRTPRRTSRRPQAQEICTGGSLSMMISRAATLTTKRLYAYADALRWATQVARALQYLHESQPQVLHRDLKAENLLPTERGRGGDVRVMDFGLMKLRSALPPSPPKISCCPAAMSPCLFCMEVWRNRPSFRFPTSACGPVGSSGACPVTGTAE